MTKTQRFTFIVDVDVEHVAGRFASRDTIAARLIEELQSASDTVTLYGFSENSDTATEYKLDSWLVRRVEPHS